MTSPLSAGDESQGLVQPIEVDSITVQTGRLICEIAIPDARYRMVSPALAAYMRAQIPSLVRHSCVNGVGDTFGTVLDTTSVPHLLEHLAIDAQVRAAQDSDAPFVGTTEWLDEIAGTARITLSFTDDLVALRAFNEAVIFLNDAVVAYQP